MSFNRYKSVNFGPRRTGLTSVGYALFEATEWILAFEVLSPLGNHTGIYGAVITFPDNYQGDLIWTTDITETASNIVYLIEDINFVNIDLDQTLPDEQSATVGGSLAAAWATGWGKIIRDVTNKLLSVWGPGNTTDTASQVFDLDNPSNPNSRTPME